MGTDTSTPQPTGEFNDLLERVLKDPRIEQVARLKGVDLTDGDAVQALVKSLPTNLLEALREPRTQLTARRASRAVNMVRSLHVRQALKDYQDIAKMTS